MRSFLGRGLRFFYSAVHPSSHGLKLLWHDISWVNGFFSAEQRLLNIRMPQDHLVRLLHKLGSELAEMRQVAKRANELFPTRYRDLQRQYGDQPGARRERACLVDARYLAYIEELAQLRSRALQLKIQYDSHVMLYQARQSLRLARHQAPENSR